MNPFKVAGKAIRKEAKKRFHEAFATLLGLLVGLLILDGILLVGGTDVQLGYNLNNGRFLSQLYPNQKVDAAFQCAWDGVEVGESGLGLLLFELGCRVAIR